MIGEIVAILFPVYAIVGVGFAYARRHAPDMSAANRLNLEVFTPALIFSVLSGEDFHPGAYQALGTGAVAVVLGSGLLAWPVARALGYPLRTFLPPMMFTNSGNMGLPLAVLAFGPAGLPGAVVLFVVENVLHFTLGNALLARRVHPLALLRMPMLAAALAGLGVNLAGLTVPAPAAEAVALLGQVSIPLMLFALGVRLTGIDLREWRIGLVGAVTCPLAGIAVAAAMVALLGLQGLQAHQLLLFGALPPAVLNYLLAERFGQEPQRVASIVLLGNLASVVFVPAVLAVILAGG